MLSLFAFGKEKNVNGFLKNGLLVVGGVVLGSMMTQKAIIDTLHSKDISIRQNQRE